MSSLEAALTALLGHRVTPADVTAIGATALADATRKFAVVDREQRKKHVVLCSPESDPQRMAATAQTIRKVKDALGPTLGAHVIDVVAVGDWNGLSLAAFPHCVGLSTNALVGRVQRSLVAPRVFEWLRKATKATASDPTPDERDAFRSALVECTTVPVLSDRVRKAAAASIARLDGARFISKRVLMHQDFWIGNVMMAAPNDREAGWRDSFVIIDWPAAMIRGFAIIDLLRFAHSSSASHDVLRREVDAHCRILGCPLEDSRAHLLAFAGHLWSTLGEFPRGKFVELVEGCLSMLETVGAVESSSASSAA